MVQHIHTFLFDSGHLTQARIETCWKMRFDLVGFACGKSNASDTFHLHIAWPCRRKAAPQSPVEVPWMQQASLLQWSRFAPEPPPPHYRSNAFFSLQLCRMPQHRPRPWALPRHGLLFRMWCATLSLRAYVRWVISRAPSAKCA